MGLLWYSSIIEHDSNLDSLNFNFSELLTDFFLRVNIHGVYMTFKYADIGVWVEISEEGGISLP